MTVVIRLTTFMVAVQLLFGHIPDGAMATGTLTQFHRTWAAVLRIKGAGVAYGLLKAKYGSDREHQHAAAHFFGELLYRQYGLASLVYCDQAFAFGCYHGFLSLAIRKEGPEILTQADSVCSARYGERQDCQHGIGHGIMEFVGRDKVREALEECAKLSWKGELFGCSGGVFMEYNLPVVVSGESAVMTPRPFDRDHPYAPCNDVPERFRPSCYYELPQYWEKVLAQDYATLGNLCRVVSEGKLRTVCFRGIGRMSASSSLFEAPKTRAWCDTMSTAEGRRLCLTEAIENFAVQSTGSAALRALCEEGIPAPACQ